MCHDRLREAMREADKAIARTAELRPRLERRTGRVDAPTRAQAEELCRRLQYVPEQQAREIVLYEPSPWPIVVVTAACVSTALLIAALL